MILCNNAKKIEEPFTYEEYREIKTQKDIEDFDWVTGNFHDACIDEKKYWMEENCI